MPKHYKKPAEEPESKKEESTADSEKKAKIKPVPTRFKGIREGLNKWKVTPITGLFLILFSICILLALTSFLFTWQSDNATVNSTGHPQRMANWLGFAGAKLSDFFINSGFGVASFGFVLLFFLAGVKLLIGRSLMPLGKTFRITIFLIIWISVCLGFIFHSNHLFLGGEVGLICSDKMVTLIGSSGTIIALCFLALAFLVINNLMSFSFASKTPKLEEEKVPVLPEPIQPVEASKNTIIEPETLSNTIEFAVETPAVAEKKKEKTEVKKQEGVEFSIEKVPVVVVPEELGEKKISDSPYDPTLELSSYKFPPIDLLPGYGKDEVSIDAEELTANKDKIVATLAHYGIEIKKIKATPGPTVTLYEIVPQDGTRISKIKNLEDDIALSLSALGIRIIAPMPGLGTIGIEVPNRNPGLVSMKTIISSDQFQKANMELPLALGKTISDLPYVVDLTKMPHLLMAGATGQGKSVGLNAIIVSILYKKHPSQVKLVLVDPKRVELSLFNKIERHFLAKLPDAEDAIITDTKKVINTLNSLCIEMEQRLELLKDAGVRNIKEYNEKFVARRLNPQSGHKFLPYIVVIIDEFADLIMTAGKEVETPLQRLAQVARATGIHLIIATQRPSVNIITGTIKANFPARIAFKVTSKIDSRTILDTGGADQLVGKGDMLISTGSDLIRLQCALVGTKEVEDICEYIGSQQGYATAFNLPEYVEEGGDSSAGELSADEKDSMFDQCARIVVETQQGSASLLIVWDCRSI
jgi:DNA segregation ATPase FtsK/SpoIIIE, S-DNA-T family